MGGDDEVVDVREVQQAENGEQGEEQRSDACEADEVEVANAYLGGGLPAAERGCGDEKAGDREENLNTVLALPDQGCYQGLRQPG